MFIVSYPRSGHHMLEKLLYEIFTELGLEYSYCEYYFCCGTIPCKKKRIFQKIHNEGYLDGLDKENSKMIILYRENMIYQLEALFRYSAAGHYGNFEQELVQENNRLSVKYIKNCSINYDDPNIFSELVKFIKKHKKGHESWKTHYINNNPCRKKVIIDYYEFLKSPLKFIEAILSLYNPELKYNVDTINRIIEKNDIKLKNPLDERIYNKLDKIINEDNQDNSDNSDVFKPRW